MISSKVVFGLLFRVNATRGFGLRFGEDHQRTKRTQQREEERGKKQNSLNFEVDETAYENDKRIFQHGALFLIGEGQSNGNRIHGPSSY
jgi:hypothetical protein